MYMARRYMVPELILQLLARFKVPLGEDHSSDRCQASTTLSTGTRMAHRCTSRGARSARADSHAQDKLLAQPVLGWF